MWNKCLPAEKPGAMIRFCGAVSTDTGVAVGLTYNRSNGWKRQRLHFSTTFSHLGPICNVKVNINTLHAKLHNNMSWNKNKKENCLMINIVVKVIGAKI